MTYKYNLLSQTDRHPKIKKNEQKLGIHTRVLHLAPARSSGFNVCPMASEGCEAACLNYAGFKYARKQQARVNRTHMFFHQRKEFMHRLAREIFSTMDFAYKCGLSPGIRLNGTSDIRWENVPVELPSGAYYDNIMEMFCDVQFMDYTKIANRRGLPPNYRLVFSRSETNDDDCRKALENGMNVAVVFLEELPETFWGLRVIDGDEHDWRFGDYEEYPNERVIVGLRAKGHLAAQDTTGFVVRP